MRALIFIFSLLFLTLNSAQAASAGDVSINEVAWMGTKTSANDEWIELYNNTLSPINLDGWMLKAIDGSPKINLTGAIPAKSFYLLERTNDNTVPNISADQIYTGALGNQGEKLDLHDDSGNLVDSADGSDGWPAGDNATKQTMERKNDGSWQTSQNSGGTPKTQNSILIQKITAARPEAEIKNGPTKMATVPKSPEKDSGWQSLAATGEPASRASSTAFVVLAAAGLAVFSGTIILVLKKRIK